MSFRLSPTYRDTHAGIFLVLRSGESPIFRTDIAMTGKIFGVSLYYDVTHSIPS